MRRRFFNNNIKDFDINDYLTIEALEDNLQVLFSNEDLMYGIDGLGWQKLVSNTYSPAISKGQTISFKGNVKSNELNPRIFTISKKCNLLGNCMSLLFGDDAVNNNSLSGKNYAFRNLFSGCTTIIQVSDSFLPATTLAGNCYFGMFNGCTSLTTAPELPATTLAGNCYFGMFNGCTSLTTAPELPATTLAGNCYCLMFEGCTSLITAPELPATTLAYGCYSQMFYGCSKLNYIKMLATDISASGCLSNWVYRVSSTGTFVKNPAMTTLPSGSSGIPSGWTVVDDEKESGGTSGPVTFSVQDTEGLITEYTIPYQMTWGEFINSEYNKSLYNSWSSQYFKEFKTSEDNGKYYVQYRESVKYCDFYQMLYLYNWNYIYTDELIEPTQYTNM